MPILKINIAHRDPIFTGMRIFQSVNQNDLWQDGNKVAEKPAADFFEIDTAALDAAKIFYQVFVGVEFFTAGGLSWKTEPYVVYNRYFDDMLHLEDADVDNPFIWGTKDIGLWREDATARYTPDTDAVFALFKKLYSNSAKQTLAAPYLFSMEGNIYFGGSAYLYTTTSFSNIGFNTFMKDTLTEAAAGGDGYNPKFDLIKNGARWRLEFLTNTQTALTGRFMGLGTNLTPNKNAITNGVHIPDIAINKEGSNPYAVTQSGSSQITTSIQSSLSATWKPSFAMKYMGRH